MMTMKCSTKCFFMFALTGFCLLFCFVASLSFAQTENTSIFFYSSETNINNFKSLKMEFDSYLAQFGAYEFQPFSEQQTFEDYIKTQQRCLILLSSWHYENIREAFRLTPLLVGSRKGSSRQKRVLVASAGTTGPEALTSGQIASAGSIQYTRTLLNDMLAQPELVEELRILTVPKDIDALMSLGFGMAKAAISTDYSLETLAGMNPALHKKLTVLAESRESRLLLLAAPEGWEDKARHVMTIFQDMAADPEGQKRLRMLGLDGWQAFDASDATGVEDENDERS